MAAKRGKTFGKGKLGSGSRFKACVRRMSARPGVYDPEGLCAAIGRRAYGKKGMAALSQASRVRRSGNPYEEHIFRTNKGDHKEVIEASVTHLVMVPLNLSDEEVKAGEFPYLVIRTFSLVEAQDTARRHHSNDIWERLPDRSFAPLGVSNPSGNLPAWPGASTVYGKIMGFLDWYGKQQYQKGSYRKGRRVHPTEEHRDMIAELGKGDEETLKHRLHWISTYYPQYPLDARKNPPDRYQAVPDRRLGGGMWGVLDTHTHQMVDRGPSQGQAEEKADRLNQGEGDRRSLEWEVMRSRGMNPEGGEVPATLAEAKKRLPYTRSVLTAATRKLWDSGAGWRIEDDGTPSYGNEKFRVYFYRSTHGTVFGAVYRLKHNPPGDPEDRKSAGYLSSILKSLDRDGMFYDVMREHSGLSFTLRRHDDGDLTAVVKDINQTPRGPEVVVPEDQIQDVYHYALHHGTLEGWEAGSQGYRPNPEGSGPLDPQTRKRMLEFLWKETPKDYRSGRGAGRRILVRGDSGTESVLLESLSDDQIRIHLGLQVGRVGNPGKSEKAEKYIRTIKSEQGREYADQLLQWMIGNTSYRPPIPYYMPVATASKIRKGLEKATGLSAIDRSPRQGNPIKELPDGRRFPEYEGQTLSWDIGLYMTHSEQQKGYPKARAVIRAMMEERPEQLERERRDMLRASFDRMFGHNAKKELDLIEEETGRRDNPADSAAAMYATFHGHPPTETLEVTDEIHYHGHLAALGDLVRLKVTTPAGLKATIDFSKEDRPVLASNEDGTQLYIRGGDQEIGLKELGIEGPEAERDSVVVGEIQQVEYRCRKKFDDMRQIVYFHKLGSEPDGPLPVLVYDTLNQLLTISGGAYRVEDVGIVG